MSSQGPCRIKVLISGSGTNLQAIIDAIGRGEITGRITEVISNRPDVQGLARAQTAGIPTSVLDHRNAATREDYDRALAEHIDTTETDLVVLAGFMRILTDGFVERFMGRLINIHPSLLPAYRGLHTHARAIAAGESHAGCSVHYVIPELDAGPVIAQAAVAIAPQETEESLQRKVQAMEHRLYPQVVGWIAEGRVHMHEGCVCMDGKPLTAPPCLREDPTP